MLVRKHVCGVFSDFHYVCARAKMCMVMCGDGGWIIIPPLPYTENTNLKQLHSGMKCISHTQMC